MFIEKLNLVDALGLIAGVLTTIAFIPQLIKTWTSKSAEDVSVLMFVLFIFGVVLWCLYGFLIHANPVIFANLITFILALSILIMKIIFDSSSKLEKKIDNE